MSRIPAAIGRTVAAFAVLLAAADLLALANGAEAAGPRKLALVIGNDAYEHQPALVKAVGDAHAMQESLERLGFEVTLAVDLDYSGMVSALTSFQSSIEPGDTVAFHFSGHGVAANGRNYLLPVDFPQPESGRQGEAILPRLAFDAGEIVDGLRSQGAALTLAVFDACRDNALSTGTRAIGMSRGLVRMDPPRGVFVMFSAGPGELAADRLSDDDPAPTSVFTRVFVPILETPGLTLVEIAKRTQVKVSELAATVDHQQFPDYSDRVIGDVVLLPGAQPDELATPAPSPAPAASQLAAVAPTTTPPAGSVDSSMLSPVDTEAALCDSVAGDPYDPLLPASVDRTHLFDLEGLLDLANSREIPPGSPGAAEAAALLDQLRQSAAACEAAMNRNPAAKRFAYGYLRALCLSGTSEKCAETVQSTGLKDYPSAAKFLAFVGLSTVSEEGAAGGLPGMLEQMHLNTWLGVPSADLTGTAELVGRLRELLASASAGGDREANTLLLLFDEADLALRTARLQIAGADGLPIGLPVVATFIAQRFELTPEMRALLEKATAQGSRFAPIMLLAEYEKAKTPENIQHAIEVLTPLATRSPTAAMILDRVKADAERLASAPAATEAPSARSTPNFTETPVVPTVSSDVDFGDDLGNYANNGVCDDRRFTGTGMTTTTLIGDDVRHDATDCRTAFEAGTVTVLAPPTPAGKEAAKAVDFGDDGSIYANNGVCDDSRFSGVGMTDMGQLESDILHDATDCRTAFEGERITLSSSEPTATTPTAPPPATSFDEIDFGDDSGSYANDGVCDDRRFMGSVMMETLSGSHVRHDATDCRADYAAGRVIFRFAPNATSVAAAAAVDFGDDASDYANDGLCDDNRFEGTAMTNTGLIEADITHDATDCRAAFEAGLVSLR